MNRSCCLLASRRARRGVRSCCAVMTLAAVLLLSAGCATVGRDFPVAQIPRIQIGQTTQDDIRTMFGDPWRVGIENGERTWTYGRYRYGLFSETSTRDLVVRFNDAGIVSSYTYNTTE